MHFWSGHHYAETLRAVTKLSLKKLVSVMSLYYHSCTFEIVGLDLKDEGKLCRTLDKSSLNLVAVA